MTETPPWQWEETTWREHVGHIRASLGEVHRAIGVETNPLLQTTVGLD